MLNGSTSRPEGPSHALPLSRPLVYWRVIGLILVTVGVYFLTQIVAALVVQITAAFLYGSDTERAAKVLTDSVVGQFFFILLAETFVLLFVWQFLRRQGKKLTDIGLGKPKLQHVPPALLGVVAFYALVFTVTAVLLTLIPGIDTEQAQDIGFGSVSSQSDYFISFVSLVILPPIGEEILMRGYLFTGLRRKLRFWPTAIIISVLFGIAHLQLGNGEPPLWIAAINTTVLSFVLVYLRERTGSLWPGIYVHAVNNLVAYTLYFNLLHLNLQT